MAADERELLDFFADQYWPLRRVGFLLTGNWHEADVMQTATMRFWGLGQLVRAPPRARVRVTADGGASTTRPLPPRSIENSRHPCKANAPWQVVPLP